MDLGRVDSIYIGPEDEAPMQPVGAVDAVAGRGLEGDRYFHGNDQPGDPTEEITLIEVEPIDRAPSEHGLYITPADMRRNIVTRGVDLRALVGRKFRVGDVLVEALEENPPCRHLQHLAGKELLKPMIDDGGVRGRIVEGGSIREGDRITLDSDQEE